jgi:hypothetical protein
MPPYSLRFIPALAAIVFGILMVTPQFGQGQEAAAGLAEYAPYMPGNEVPDGLNCESTNGFYEQVQILCRTQGGSHCEHGYVIARDGIIIHTTFFRCHFPVAYLTAEYGRYEQVRRYTKIMVLRWPNAYAHVRRTGWLNAMAPVSIVTWWRPTPTPESDSQ